jgi:hypothetical protein
MSAIERPLVQEETNQLAHEEWVPPCAVDDGLSQRFRCWSVGGGCDHLGHGVGPQASEVHRHV